jgi:hypothetical protein
VAWDRTLSSLVKLHLAAARRKKRREQTKVVIHELNMNFISRPLLAQDCVRRDAPFLVAIGVHSGHWSVRS